jgi:hypothetical protein
MCRHMVDGDTPLSGSHREKKPASAFHHQGSEIIRPSAMLTRRIASALCLLKGPADRAAGRNPRTAPAGFFTRTTFFYRKRAPGV